MSRSQSSPNVLVFFTDQQRWDTCGCYGSPMELTPNLDAMARRGVRFENVFTCQPVCAPARASLQTGLHGTAHGVWRNGLALDPSHRTLAHHFRAAGYEVGYLGKWHLSGTGDRPVPLELRGGYEGYWEGADILEFTSHPYDCRMYDQDNEPVYYPGYRVDAMTDRAVEFISRDREAPFFFFVSYLEPHHQNDMDRFVPPERYAASYKNPYVPPDLRARPGNWQESLPGYYGCVRALDEALGRVLEALEQRGIADNTVVLFTSDHGCHFRTRNAEYKRSCHDGCTRIPMVMQGPGLNLSRSVPQMVSVVDFAPTLLSAAGLAVPQAMQGRDATALVGGAEGEWEEEVFIQISEYTVGRAIRTPRWKYCVHDPHNSGWGKPAAAGYVEHHLYDLYADPWEQVNLIGRREYDGQRAHLKERLLAHMGAAGEAEVEILDGKFYE